MTRNLVRQALALAVATMSVGVTPSQAGPVDGWVVIDAGEVRGTGEDVAALVDAAIGLVAKEAGGKACTPRRSEIAPGNLRWTVWENPYTLERALEWHGPGFASVSDDCASMLDLTVQVTDHAGNGVVYGDPGRAVDDTPDGGMFRAYAESHAWVLYLDPANFYWRFTSVIELKVTASYYNKKAKAMLPLGCKTTHTSVRVWPDGRVETTTGPTEDCAA